MSIESPVSKAELETALSKVVQQAYRNGVEVDNGAYELVNHDTNIPNWDVTIVRME